jgi:hypothetical protein
MRRHLAGHRDDLPPTKETENTVDNDNYDHPLTMEVQSTLTNIFLTHARPYEALDTVSALWKQAKRTLDEHHPANPEILFPARRHRAVHRQLRAVRGALAVRLQ